MIEPRAGREELLVRAVTPRLTGYIPHRPTPPQAAFLCLPGTEAFYGGAAGGGKSDALLMAALQYADVLGYAALLVRETFQMLNQPGGLLTRAREWLAGTDAVWIAAEHQWRFPSGATLTFRHMQDAGAERNFQGAEYHFIGIDEVTDLLEDEYRFLFSRLRRGHDSRIPLRMRAASNPYGPGLEWVHRRFVIEGRAKGRVFIPARLEDNPYLDQESYELSLKELGRLTYRKLRHGDWTARPDGGLFQDAWFTERFLDRRELPEHLHLCRAWDFAATEAGHGSDPDYTAGVLLGRSGDGVCYVLDVCRARGSPLEVERLVRRTAEVDKVLADERGHHRPTIRIEQEPGSAGAVVIDHYRRTVLPEFTVKGVRSTGTKEVRAAPVAARAEAGELWICRGTWNTTFLDELVAFPAGSHDDQVDGLAAAYEQLARRRASVVPMPIGFPRESVWRF
ncbi:MAG: phage terminase large subunit [Gemmatimonadota bacterium]|nr:phage terminase large subunit [Gemmatimonadota bacterium]